MKPAPPNDGADPADLRASLSALMDGLADATAVQRASAHWRDDPATRSAWHAYHLIGDVLRSDDLASPPAHDAAFLAALRLKLAGEPTVMAPEPAVAPAALPPQRRRGPAWLVPAAMAAGFVAVAGVLLVTRMSAPGPALAPVLASNPVSSDGVRRVTTAPQGRLPNQPLALSDATVIRDAQLDAYLRAHRDMRGGGAALPGGALRSVETVALER